MRLLVGLFILLANPAVYGEDISLVKLKFPLDCKLGESCWIARYSDHDKGPGKADYRCNDRTQHTHRGTDIAIKNLQIMAEGVDVLAAADGIVTIIRDGITDEFATKENRAEKSKIGNGNTLGIRHSDGSISVYSHMKKHSLTVKKGDSVKVGQKIGEIGMSGLTEYPHLHFALRYNNEWYDPFNQKPLTAACSTNKPTGAWDPEIPYKVMALLPPTLTSTLPNRQSRWDAPTATLSKNVSHLYLNGHAFGVQKGDRWLFKFIRPDGRTAYEKGVSVAANRQLYGRSNRIARPEGGFMPGIWTGEILVLRQAKDGSITKFKQETRIEVTK